MSPKTPSDRRAGLLRLAVIALCLVMTFWALAGLVRWRAERTELVEILKQIQVGDSHQTAIRRVSFERTSHHARLIVARALVYDVLTTEPNATSVDRLTRAHDLAREVLVEQPNSWQASMLLGASTYLEWSLRSDRRLFTSAPDWERPLLKAVAEADGKPEPRRFLLSAYLETWAALSAEKKALTRDLIEQAFRDDPDSLARLLPIWLEVAEDLSSALEVIPDRPAAWQLLKRDFAGTHEWDSFGLAHTRYLDALERQLTRNLDEAGKRLRLGDYYNGRTMCLRVVVAAPPDGRFAALVAQALELYPPGLHGLSSSEALRKWLLWSLELNAVSIDPFSSHVLSRLTDAVGEIEPPIGALASLIGEDLYQTKRYEKLEPAKNAPAWAPFLIAKTQRLIDRQELSLAEETLAEVHRSARGRASYWLARQRLARATGDLVDLASADRELADLRAEEWQSHQWRWRGHRASIEIYPERAASGIEIQLGEAPGQGAVVQVMWDGTAITHMPVRAQETLEIEWEVTPRPHQLELRSLAGGEVYPGRVLLLESSAGDPAS
ncbi:MAG: hypothetical protein GY719_11005 [bacterium]|nr:hypothetical protein [bacterium]